MSWNMSFILNSLPVKYTGENASLTEKIAFKTRNFPSLAPTWTQSSVLSVTVYFHDN